MTVTVEERRVRELFEAVDKAEAVAKGFPEGDERRTDLLSVSNTVMAQVGTVRAVIAARLLGVNEKTVRAWAEQGVLAIAQREPRLLLDAPSVYHIGRLIRQLREAGQHRGLLEEIWRRLQDQALVESDDFQEGLAQIQRGEFEELPLPEDNGRGR